MPAPNLFIVYVTDVAVSSAFYSNLFGGPTPGSWTQGVITQQVAA